MSTSFFSSTLPHEKGAAQINKRPSLGQRTYQQVLQTTRKVYTFQGKYPDTKLVHGPRYEDGILNTYPSHSLPDPKRTGDYVRYQSKPVIVHTVYNTSAKDSVTMMSVEIPPSTIQWA